MADVPAQAGDIAWMELDPVQGTEQGGRRPALVISSAEYHKHSRRSVVCPITSKIRDWPFNVPLPEGLAVQGLILVDQVRTVDRSVCPFKVVGTVPPETLAEVRARLAVLTGIPLLPSNTREPA